MTREFGSDFDLLPVSDGYFTNLGGKTLNKVYLRSGREAIRLAINSVGKSNNIVLLPAYLCPSMLNPFIEKDWTYKYYQVDRKLEIDEDEILNIVADSRPAILYLISYFGYCNYGTLAKKTKQISPETKVLFDFTQCIFDFNEIYDESIDFYIGSIRKWLGIASGAVFLTKENINNSHINIDQTAYNSLKSQALLLKQLYLYNGKVDVKNRLKELKSVADSELDFHSIYFANAEDIQRIENVNAGVISSIRKQNYMHLKKLLHNNPKIDISLADRNTNSSYFMYPIFVSDRKNFQKVLSDKGIYAQVIWGLPDDAKKFETSLYVYEHILCLPIDQRYNYWDIEEMGEIINQESNKFY